MELELRHLRVLCAIADAGSVGRAAAQLGYSQPAVSTQLRRIESHLGEALFERGTGGARPTRYGTEVVAQARDVLARADAIGHRPAAVRALRSLRVAATNSPMLSGTVSRVRARLPELSLAVNSVYASSRIVELLEEGGADIAIAADYPGMELRHSCAVRHRGIITEPTFVALPSRHRLRQCAQVQLADLAEDGWFVTPDDGAGWPGVFYDACKAAGFTPVTVHEFLGDQIQLQSMIADGLGVSLVQPTLRPIPHVDVKPLAGSPLWCRYVLAWRPDTVTDEVVESVLQSATAAYRDLVAQAPHLRTWASRTWSVAGA
ncbi:LysR family transcriptional regulator [Streptomyces pluripotens]|uniref:LysR family transcriptional regulator n=1 Tax=Streptomyces pluripotens TaxID=1355015 RepID=A0A221P740_9ACTN|nr:MULTISPECIES: LysR family transcriptional regulator [Streptomyces]ARP73659.1 LysR family transcriptional regulator [Streptomyces pluripotens]ASN27906.1 LysR family transcriptional regulator [Streptomyces pluripotens]KIE24379.1 LysR family transcriptional regulator [Streptomyces sp. MUSC 125]MCH0559489.1 LysR family transcriptional regulator [Streptomyces sp. MUM 16J]